MNGVCAVRLGPFGLLDAEPKALALTISEAQPLPDRRGEPRLVHGVEVQAARSGREQPVAQVGHYVETQASNRGGVVAKTLHLQAQPARKLGAAGVREAGKLREIPDRHDSRYDGQADAERFAVVDEAQIGIDVVEILRDRSVRARVDLALEIPQVLVRAARLGMELRIAGDFDVEMIAGSFAYEGHQLARVAKLSRARGARRQVPAQGDDVSDALGLVKLERGGDVGARCAD